jgi:DNA adenine methylase
VAAETPAAEVALKPFLRWAGSKRKLVKRLKTYWQPHHRRYIEPFAGSACLFFELLPRAAVLGDSNRELIEVYRQVRDNPEAVYRRLVHIPRDATAYYRWRAISPRTLDPQTRALRFLYLNRTCFNGIFRTNVAGDFNVPFGRKQGRLPTKNDFLESAEQLSRAKLIAGDFSRTLAHVEKHDFVYLDPPFAVGARRVFRQYGIKPFETTDVARLARELRRLHKIGASFLVSYADCSESRRLGAEWNAVRLSVRRHVAGFAGDRKRAFEWLISNADAEDLDSCEY